MASFFDGDPGPIYDIINDPEADEFVRRGVDALVILVLHGELDRDEVAKFLQSSFTDLQPQGPCAVWNGWLGAVAALGLTELTPLVREAFERDFVEQSHSDFEEFEADLERSAPAMRLRPSSLEAARSSRMLHRQAARGAANDRNGRRSLRHEEWDDFEEADRQIQDYDPLVEPDPDQWLAADEQERIDAVKYYPRDARSEAERSTVHAVIHVVVENQSAEGDELPVRRTMTRLMDQGLDRHQAIHAVGSVLAGHIHELMREAKAGRDPEGDVNVPYFAELARLTAIDWLKSG